MIRPIKVLLAVHAELEQIVYPVLVTPKLDGIRCAVVDGHAMSRNMKPIKNNYVREQLKGLSALDGELMVIGGFDQVSSEIMSEDGEPNFVYHVFDTFHEDLAHLPYGERVEHLAWMDDHPFIQVLLPKFIRNEEELLKYYNACLRNDYEGIIIRDPSKPYKFGRSTVKEGILLKLTPLLTAEGVVVEFIEKMTNNNPKEKDELGRAKRSSHKANLSPANTLGSIILNWNGLEISVGLGKGITDEIKQKWWDARHESKGKMMRFSYRELTDKGIPRFGKSDGFRDKDDM